MKCCGWKIWVAGVLIGVQSLVYGLESEMPTMSAAGKETIMGHRAAGKNLLTNGSFELGLGGEPFYPGWMSPVIKTEAYPRGRQVVPLPDEVPPRPVIDDTVAHNGGRSLKFIKIPGRCRAVIAFQPQILPEETKSEFSLWIRASHAGVKFTAGICPKPNNGPNPFAPHLNGDVDGEWREIRGILPAQTGYTQVRAEIASTREEPFDLWVDDVCWTVEAHDASVRSGSVEAVLLPQSTTGIHFAEKPVTLVWSADAEKNRDVAMRLTLNDLTRDNKMEDVWKNTTTLSPSVKEGTIPLGKLRRGAYLATLHITDPATGESLGIGRERFTVLTDLRTIAAPVDFTVGMHYGMGFGPYLYFNWRGYWSPDEFFDMCYQTGFRVQRMIWHWEDVEPQEGVYTWEQSNMDRLIQAALRHGCTSIPCIPAYPLNMKQEEDNKRAGKDADGFWICNKGRDISSFSRRSAVMGYSKEQSQRKLLFAPPEGALARFCSAFANRYRGKIAALELMNESNLYINPDGLLEYYFKEAYPAVKSVAPEMPVLMNQTMDYASDGNGYTGQFFALGAMKYCDGFTHHPYGRSLLESDALEGVRTLRRLADEYSTPEKPMILGMTEVHFLGEFFARGEVVQRALLDWSIGCRWSAGVIMDGSLFYEGGKRDKFFRKGPSAPGVGSVYLNGMYSVLGGSRFMRRIDRDDNVLISCFENPTQKQPLYTAALTSANFPTRTCLLHVDLGGIPVKAFDGLGEETELIASGKISLRQETLYLQSTSAELIQRLESGNIVWGQQISAIVEEYPQAIKDSYPRVDEALLLNGVPPKRVATCNMLDQWQIVTVKNISPELSPVEAGVMTTDGDLIETLKQNATHSISGQEYITLSIDKKSAADVHYGYGVLYADEAINAPFALSSNRPLRLWVNGVLVHDGLGQLPQLQGRSWMDLSLPLKTGMNHLLVQGCGTPCTFALVPSENRAGKDAPDVDEDGYLRKWVIVGPWNNIRDADGQFIGLDKAFLNEKQLAENGPNANESWMGKLVNKRRLPLVWFETISPTPAVSHPWEDAISYAYAEVISEREQECLLSLGSDDGYAIWLNGVEIGRQSISRGLKLDSDSFPVKLLAGKNRILFKIEDTGAGGGFAVRFVTQPDF